MSTPSQGQQGPGGSALPGDREIATSTFAEPDNRPSRLPATDPSRRSVVQVAGAVAGDVSVLVQAHVELAKTEIQASAKAAGKSVGMFAGAGILGYFSVFMFMVAAAEGLVALGLWRWLSYLIVALVLVLIAAILALVGQRGLKGVKGMPKTQKSVEDSKAILSEKASRSREE